MDNSFQKYQKKEDYIVPMTVAEKAGHLHTVILGEMAKYIVGKRVIHIGCNSATTTYHIAPLNPSCLVGVDVNKNAIELAKKTLPDTEFVTASASKLPFGGNSFDTIVLFAVFEHLFEEDKRPAIEEFKRILSPDGVILLQLPKATPGSKDQRLKQNAYDPHHISFYFAEDDVDGDLPGFERVKLYHETRRNPNNNAPHSAWVGIYRRA